MEVGENDIGYIGTAVTQFVQLRFKVDDAFEMIVFQVVELFLPGSGVHQYQPVAGIHQQAAHGQYAEVFFVAGISFLPHPLGHHTEHSSAVGKECTGFNFVQFHLFVVLV